MKYKVSLLPESRKKKLNGKKKLEKIQGWALSILIVLLALIVVVMGVKFFTDSKLKKAQQLDNEYAAKVAELEKYRQINADLQSKVALLDQIQVDEPYLYKFIINWSNTDRPGVSIDTFTCEDWKTTRQCVVTGTCNTREEYLLYEQDISKIDGVTSVAVQSFTSGVATEEGKCAFTILITVSGGKEVVTVPPSVDASFAETTIVDDVSVE